jgi:hypothetical protein
MTGPEHYIAAEELLEDVGHARDEDDAARVLGIALWGARSLLGL